MLVVFVWRVCKNVMFHSFRSSSAFGIKSYSKWGHFGIKIPEKVTQKASPGKIVPETGKRMAPGSPGSGATVYGQRSFLRARGLGIGLYVDVNIDQY